MGKAMEGKEAVPLFIKFGKLVAEIQGSSFDTVEERLTALSNLARLAVYYTEERVHPKLGKVEVAICNPAASRAAIMDIHKIYQETPPDLELNIIMGPQDSDYGLELPSESEVG